MKKLQELFTKKKETPTLETIATRVIGDKYSGTGVIEFLASADCIQGLSDFDFETLENSLDTVGEAEKSAQTVGNNLDKASESVDIIERQIFQIQSSLKMISTIIRSGYLSNTLHTNPRQYGIGLEDTAPEEKSFSIKNAQALDKFSGNIEDANAFINEFIPAIRGRLETRLSTLQKSRDDFDRFVKENTNRK